MRIGIVLAGLLTLSAGAHAADNGVYLGGSVGRSSVEVDSIAAVSGADFKGNDVGYKLIVGVRPLDWLAVEASYVNFGKPDDTVAGTKIEAKGSAITGFAVGFLTLGPVDLFAKGGLVSWDTKVQNKDLDGTDFAYGAGVQFRLLSLAVRAEYEVFDMKYLDRANMLSLGVTYTFL